MNTPSPTISRRELKERVAAEGLDPRHIVVVDAQWAETAPKASRVYSNLLYADLIVRSDGSFVILDHATSLHSKKIAAIHHGEIPESMLPKFFQVFPEVTDLDIDNPVKAAREIVGWDEYLKRLKQLV